MYTRRGVVFLHAPNCAALAVCLSFIDLASFAQSQAPFTEEAVSRGINYTTPPGFGAGRGLALIDLDHDDDADLVCTGRADHQLGFFENDGTGHFLDRTGAVGLPPYPNAVGITPADFDSDGDLDLFIARWDAPNVLLRNDGNFTFVDVTDAAGLGDASMASGCTAADYDRDGRLDLYVANMTNQAFGSGNNLLYRNLGDMVFENVAVPLGVNFDSLTWKAVFFDYDLDGWLDLYISNDKGQAACDWNNYLYQNTGGAFVDVTKQSNTGVCIDSMGVAVGDFDGNGFTDLYCTNTPYGNPLLLNNGDGTFTDATINAGVGSFATGWAALFFDYDNDTVLDLYVCNQDAPNRLYAHDGAFPCTDIASQMNVATTGPSFCAAAGDIDRDGDPDLIVQTYADRLRLYINNEGEQRNWMQARVIGSGSNTTAVGAQVRAHVGQQMQYREIYSGTNFKSQNEFVVHFGLDDADIVDELDVQWPAGPKRTLTNLPANQRWPVYPPEALGDADHDGDVDLDDFWYFANCFNADEFQPPCAIVDLDGDSDVDLADADVFVNIYDDPVEDCNNNGIADLIEILNGAADENNDGVPDACATSCPRGAVADDGMIDAADLRAVLAAWGPCDSPCPPACGVDVNADCVVNIADLLELLANWGPCE